MILIILLSGLKTLNFKKISKLLLMMLRFDVLWTYLGNCVFIVTWYITIKQVENVFVCGQKHVNISHADVNICKVSSKILKSSLFHLVQTNVKNDFLKKTCLRGMIERWLAKCCSYFLPYKSTSQ